MKTFERVSVYARKPKNGKPGKTNLPLFKKQMGVYKIFENGRLVYIGSSISNLYSTILHHFSGWQDSRSPSRITYKTKVPKNRYEIEVTVTKNATETYSLEEMLIAKHKPRDNRDQNYNFYNPKYQKGKYSTCFDCYTESVKEKVEIPPSGRFNSKGQLVDESGEIIF